jgi:hypothetical protein
MLLHPNLAPPSAWNRSRGGVFSVSGYESARPATIFGMVSLKPLLEHLRMKQMS